MSKRGAGSQLTKDDVEAGLDENQGEAGGTWKAAAPDALKERKIIKVRRKNEPTATPSVAPSFNFGTPAAAPAPSVVPSFGSGPANAFAALLDPTEWVCATCGVRNKNDATKCKACETPKPVDAAKITTPASTVPSFNFGVAGDKPSFSFGTASTGGDKPAFSFGTASTSNALFSFGAKPSGWSFGEKKEETAGTTPSFTFGSTLTGQVATFGSIDGKGFNGDGKKLDGSVASFGGATPDPTKEEFKNKERESSGEEGDTRILSMPQTKVFSLQTIYENPDAETEEKKGKKSSKWSECGQGEMHINTYKREDKNQARLVLRADKTQRLVLNAPLYAEMSAAKPEGDKFVRLSSTDLEGKPCSYLLKFKNKADVAAVLSKLEEAVKTLTK